MNTKPTILVATLSLFGLLCTLQTAQANSRFTVQNDSSAKILINVFDGNDELCSAEAKHHTLEPGEEQGMGCEGGGKHRCKARVSRHVNDSWEQICLELDSDCGKQEVNMPNNATLTVADNGSGGTACSVAEE